jgi:hypothetical protein
MGPVPYAIVSDSDAGADTAGNGVPQVWHAVAG